jgi:phosphatidylserine/phosphatidylglycerophosphate/cardiolipin synthase-like enzyme
LEGAKRASLHAKCVVVDEQMAFVSSANFTEAAQERNIEVGVLVRSQVLSTQIARHFDALVAAGLVSSLPLPQTQYLP